MNQRCNDADLQQILNVLNPQYIVEESNGTVVLGRKVGSRTVSVRGYQQGRMCVYVVVQGDGEVPLAQSYSFFRDDITNICDCLKTLIDRYENRRN